MGRCCAVPLVRVKDKAQITLPQGVRKSLGIEVGDYLQVGVDEGRVVLTPQTLTARVPTVRLSREGEQMLAEALDDVRQGRTRAHADADSLMRELNGDAS